MIRLKRSFFEQPTLIVAKELLGKILIFNNHQGIITETEAYIGENDPACHAAKGRTNRTEIMYGIAGYSYVYMIYGIYYCFNIVTEQKNFPAAVLIRAVYYDKQHINGPGKLCKIFGIDKKSNKIDLMNAESFYVAKQKKSYDFSYINTPRIGIKQGLDKLWRFKMILSNDVV